MTRSAQRPPPHTKANDKRHNFKECAKCGETKRLADFHIRDGSRKYKAADPRRYKNRCADCCRATSAIEVDPNFRPDRNPIGRPKSNQTPAQLRAGRAEYKRLARRTARIKALEYLADKGCCHCGNRDPRVLEFDHLDQEDKSDCVGRLLSNGYSWGSERLRAEIRKCRVICANCHRLHTATQMEYYGHDDVRDALDRIDAKYHIA